jgi:signal transduction histidine kinase
MVRELGEQYQCANKNINWHIECEEAVVSADPKIKTAIEELIDNAVQHNPHEGLNITLSVTESDDDKQILIQVIDTGQPIPDVEIEPIAGGYDPDPLEHGEGIGLWEVQTIINAHGGRLSVKENSLERKVIEIALPRVQL